MFLAGNRSHAIIPLFVFANVLPLNMLYFETACSLRKGNVLTSGDSYQIGQWKHSNR